MKKYATMAELKSAKISHELKDFLVKKSEKIMTEYGLSDISDTFCVTVLDKNEADYLTDKYLEFIEIQAFDGVDYVHTVWIVDDGYSEDIYIPHTAENMAVVESRC